MADEKVVHQGPGGRLVASCAAATTARGTPWGAGELQPRGGGQGLHRQGPRPGRPGALRAGVRGHGRHLGAPQHPHGVRLGGGQAAAVHRHRVAQPRQRARPPRPVGPLRLARGGRRRRQGGRRPRERPPCGRAAPEPEAPQRVREPPRRAAAGGLRSVAGGVVRHPQGRSPGTPRCTPHPSCSPAASSRWRRTSTPWARSSSR